MLQTCTYAQAIVTAIQHVDNCTRNEAEVKFDSGVQYTAEEVQMRAQSL